MHRQPIDKQTVDEIIPQRPVINTDNDVVANQEEPSIDQKTRDAAFKAHAAIKSP